MDFYLFLLFIKNISLTGQFIPLLRLWGVVIIVMHNTVIVELQYLVFFFHGSNLQEQSHCQFFDGSGRSLYHRTYWYRALSPRGSVAWLEKRSYIESVVITPASYYDNISNLIPNPSHYFAWLLMQSLCTIYEKQVVMTICENQGWSGIIVPISQLFIFPKDLK